MVIEIQTLITHGLCFIAGGITVFLMMYALVKGFRPGIRGF